MNKEHTEELTTDNGIGYVILHYLAIDMTLECINVLKSQVKGNDIIVVVDNGSGNKSGIEIKDIYKDDKQVVVILNPYNYGFAKGNNVGFMYLKNHYKCDFIVMMNNDVLLLQKNWRERIFDVYKNNHFAVLGPRVFDKDGHDTYSNPQSPVHSTVASVYVGIFSAFVRIILSFIGLDIWLNLILDKQIQAKEYNTEVYNMQLSGCCWIFSRDYIDIFDGINDRTFLYLEEEILFMTLQKKKMTSLYSPKLEIVHLEDVSTNQANSLFSNSKKRRFKYKNQLHSFYVLRDVLKNKY